MVKNFPTSPSIALALMQPLAEPQQAGLSWPCVAAALSPVIGPMGVKALLQRSVFLLPNSHAEHFERVAPAGSLDEVLAAIALAQYPPNVSPSIDCAQGRAMAQSVSEADANLRQTFSALLTSLIGPALCQRLLATAGSEANKNKGKQFHHEHWQN